MLNPFVVSQLVHPGLEHITRVGPETNFTHHQTVMGYGRNHDRVFFKFTCNFHSNFRKVNPLKTKEGSYMEDSKERHILGYEGDIQQNLRTPGLT